MRIEEFLTRHGLSINPFANAEEAQGDQVLLDLLASRQFHYGHPQWPKFLGDPPGNQTSVVFGFKGSGKTAMRLALGAAIEDYNRQRTEGRVLVVNYDEFNTYLASWKAHIDRALLRHRGLWDRILRRPVPTASQAQHWRLAHHIDAILAEIVRKFAELLASSHTNVRRWPNRVKYDVLLLAAVYLPGRSNDYVQAIRRLHGMLFGGTGSLRNDLFYVLATTLTLGGYFAYRYGQAQGLAKKLARRVQVLERDVPDRRWALQTAPGRLPEEPAAVGGLPRPDRRGRPLRDARKGRRHRPPGRLRPHRRGDRQGGRTLGGARRL